MKPRGNKDKLEQKKGVDKLKNEILKRLKLVKGNVGFYYKNLITNEEICFNENESFLPASVIKFPIMVEVFHQVNLGKVNLFQSIKVKDTDKVPGCGALSLFTDEIMVNIKTLLNLMIEISDNTATNVLINYFGIDKLNEGFKELGLEKTKINRLLFDSEAKKLGKENIFVPKEIGYLLEKIYNRKLINEEASFEMEKILLNQQINSKIPAKLPEDIGIAHKTGEDTNITNDVGIVYADKPFVIVFASNNVDVPEFEDLIREISLICFNG